MRYTIMKRGNIMKKVLAIVLSVVLLLSLCACRSNDTPIEVENVYTDDPSVENTENNSSASSEETEPADSDVEETSSTDWESFLDEYEAWVDDYIEIVKKYKNNPTDMSILSDYSAMMTEMADWSTKADGVASELEDASPSELAKYSARLAKIAAKLAEAAY